MAQIITAYRITYQNAYGGINTYEIEGKKKAYNRFNNLPKEWNPTIEEIEKEVFITKPMKAEFQKVIGAVRSERGGKEYPKPMMTTVQMMKGQATVNCGGEWSTTERTREMAEAVMANNTFVEFINKYNASAKIELNNFGTYQIRLYFS